MAERSGVEPGGYGACRTGHAARSASSNWVSNGKRVGSHKGKKNIVYTLGGPEGEEQVTRALPNAAMVVACNANGQVLVHAVVKPTAEEARKLHPNNFADSPENCALPLVEILKTLGEFLGYDNLLVGWNVDADLMALHMAIPAIQVVDMSREPMVRASVEGAMKTAGIRLDPNAIRCQLPNVVAAITGKNSNCG